MRVRMASRCWCGAVPRSLPSVWPVQEDRGRAERRRQPREKERKRKKGYGAWVCSWHPFALCSLSPGGSRAAKAEALQKDFQPNPFPFKSGSKSSALRLVAGARVLVGFWKLGAGAFVNLPRAVPAQDKLQHQLCSLLRVAESWEQWVAALALPLCSAWRRLDLLGWSWTGSGPWLPNPSHLAEQSRCLLGWWSFVPVVLPS